MNSGVQSHEERSRFWPRPTFEKVHKIPGLEGLPADTLSLASMVVLVFSFFLLLLLGIDRTGEFIPFPPVVLALVVVVTSGWIAWVCMPRPGGWWPKIWSWFLALLALAVLVASLFLSDEPWVQAGVLAAGGAALVLSPRLLRVKPDSRWLRWITPATFLFVTAFMLGGVISLIWQVDGYLDSDFQRLIDSMEDATHRVQQGRELDWTNLHQAPKEFTSYLARLDRIDLKGAARLPPGPKGPVEQDWDESVEEVALDLLDAIGAALADTNAPSLGSLLPLADGDTSVSQSVLIVDYYQRLLTLFALLDPGQEWVRFPEGGRFFHAYEQLQGRVAEWLERRYEDWSGYWMLPRLPGGMALTSGRPILARHALGLSPFGPASRPTAADLPGLFEMAWGEARRSAEASTTCRPGFPAGNRRSIVCQAFFSNPENGGAQLGFWFEILYQGTEKPGSAEDGKPTELVYVFPIPRGGRWADRRAVALGELNEALSSELRSDYRRILLDPMGRVTSGYRYIDKTNGSGWRISVDPEGEKGTDRVTVRVRSEGRSFRLSPVG